MSSAKTPRDVSRNKTPAGLVDHRTMTLATIMCGLLWVAIAAYSSFFPGAFNWGTHQLAFFPPLVRIAVLAAAVAVLFSAVSSGMLARLHTAFGSGNGRSPGRKPAALLALLALAALAFWLARETTYLLGDGNLVARTLPAIQNPQQIPRTSFQNEPFAAYLIWNIYQILSQIQVAEPSIRAFQFMSILCGAAAVWIVMSLVKLLVNDRMERFLAGLAVVGTGGAELYFGYVESYAALACGMLLLYLLVLKSIRESLNPVFPAMAFGLLVSLHLGSLSMLPAFAYFLHVTRRNAGLRAAAGSAAAAVVTAAFLLWVSGYRGEALLALFTAGGGHLLPLFRGANAVEPYGLFSVAHIVDFGNLLLLLSPFTPLALGLAAAVFITKREQLDATWRFFLFSAACGVAFTFVLNCALGMSRDWDLLSPFNLGLAMTAPLGAAAWIADPLARRRVLLVICSITLLSTLPWIALNADEERSLARFEKLPEPSLWSAGALQNACDEMAALHKERKEYKKAIEYCERYLESDSGNGRIYGKMGELYALLGDDERALEAYTKALRHGVSSWKTYFSLGTTFGSRGRYAEAIDAMSKGLELNPRSAAAWRTLGEFYADGPADHVSALRSFRKALEIDPSDARSCADAGRSSFFVKDFEGMKTYFRRYSELTMTPLDSAAVRRLLNGRR